MGSAVNPEKAAPLGALGHGPLHDHSGKIGVGMTYCGQLPIKHSADLGAVRSEEKIIDAVVAVDKGALAVVFGHVVLQPVYERGHIRDVGGLTGLVLLGPTADLAGVIIALRAIVGKARSGDIYVMDCR